MQSLELKIPPPIVALATAALMWFAASLMPPFVLPDTLRVGVAVILAITGISLDLTGLIAFIRAKTTINPLRPASSAALVTNGLYRLTRNPMYLGMLLVLLGWAVFLSSLAALLVAPLFVLYINRFQIAPEERVLEEKFGAAFTDYTRRVRRWL